MTAREELARVIVTAYGENEDECPCEQDMDVADAILAAGYRKPRTISTIGELYALPTGSVIMTIGTGQRVGKIKKARDGKMIAWAIIGDNIAGMNGLYGPSFLPATVLYEPQLTEPAPTEEREQKVER